MKRKYKFYDKEALVPTSITYDFPAPFEAHLDAQLKSEHGEELTFVKEINHRARIIRLHSAYDSGKGTLYVAAPTREEQQAGVARLQALPAVVIPPVVDYDAYTLDDLPVLCQSRANKLIALNVYKRNTPGADLRDTVEAVNALFDQYAQD